MDNSQTIYRVVKLNLKDSTTYGAICFKTKEAALKETERSNSYFRIEGKERLAYVQELILFDE